LAEEKVEYEVTILSREEVVTYPTLAQPVITLQVTYVAAGLPPATISIPKEEYTKELEAQKLREDIERRLKVKPEVITV